MSHYPVPSYAASIWITGDQLWIGFPPNVTDGHGHSVPFPATLKGLAVALDVLKARANGQVNLGLRGAPCRNEIEKELANDARYNEIIRALEEGKAEAAQEREDAGKFLAELGL